YEKKAIRQYRTAVALRAKQNRDAVAFLKGLDGDVPDAVLARLRVDPSEAAAVLVAASEFKDVFAAIKELHQQRKFQAAVDRCQILRPQVQEPAIRSALDVMLTRATWMRDFDAGKWVELTFDPKLALWKTDANQWTVKDERTVVGKSTKTRRELKIMLREDFGDQFEVEAVVSSKAVAERGFDRVGFSVGSVASRRSGWLFVWVSSYHKEIGTIPYATKKAMEFDGRIHPETNKLRVQIWKDQVAAFVGDELQFTKTVPYFNSRGDLIFGTRYWEAMEFTLSNPRIRKLNSQPPPDQDDFDATIDYFSERLEKEEPSASDYRQRGRAYLEKKQFEQSLSDFQVAEKLAPDHAKTRYLLGLHWMRTGEYRKAIDALEQATKLDPEYPPPLRALAKILAACPDAAFRDGKKSVEIGLKAWAVGHWHSNATRAVIAMGYAESGNFDGAVKTAQIVLDQSKSPRRHDPESLREQYSEQLKLYQNKQPFRFSSP
ncbi:MAG: tetratricopeptide repeat protein, partial [Planctomycetales bacterium]